MEEFNFKPFNYKIENIWVDNVLYKKMTSDDSRSKNECYVVSFNPEAKEIYIKDNIDDVVVTSIDVIKEHDKDKCKIKKYNVEFIDFGNSITYICEKSLKRCNKLKNAILPKSLYAIGEYAFANCPLETITFKNTDLMYISEGAFYCDTLKYIILKGDKQEIYIDVFNKDFQEILRLFQVNKLNDLKNYMHGEYIKNQYCIDNIINMIIPIVVFDCNEITSFAQKLLCKYA